MAPSFRQPRDSPKLLATRCRDQCQDTTCWGAPRYRLDWIVVSYSTVATGAFWDSLLVVASGVPFIPACRLVLPHSLIQR